MADLIKRSGILIPKKYYNTESYVEIKEHLQRRTRTYDKSAFIINKFYIESDKFMLIPRYFPIEEFMSNFKIHNQQHKGEEIDITHNIVPRSKTQEEAIKYMLENDSGILQLMPGVGKTVISIYTIAERKRKSIILVHRDSLAEQWIQRFNQFTDIRDNIKRLKSSTFEDDLKAPVIVSTVQTMLSLLKNKRRDFLTLLNDANIGIFIADEVHTSVGAPTFSECSMHIPAKCTYGLSATPYRYDGNGDIIEYHLGPIFESDDTKGTMIPSVTVLLLDYQIDTPQRTKYIRWGGEFQRARYLNMMYKSKPFILALQGLLSRLKNERNLICIAERIKLIDKLYDWIQVDSKSKFCGSESLEALNSKITFATPGKCRDGVDAPQKDCVIMTSPISNIEQLTGRVIRDKQDKQKPIIIDMVDYGCTIIAKTLFSRLSFYRKKKWPVQYLLFVNNKIRSISEEMAMEILQKK